MLSFIFLSLFSLTSFAQTTLDDVDFTVLDPLRPVTRKGVQSNEEKNQYVMRLKKDVEMKRVMESGQYLAVIQKEAILEDLSTEKSYIIHKDINVYAYRQADGADFKYVVGKDGKIKFKVHTKYLNDITQVTDLKAKPKEWSEVQVVQELQAQDKIKSIYGQFNLHLEAIDSRYLQEVAETRYDQVNRSWRFEGQSYFHWNFPLEIGASLNYQTAHFVTVNTEGGDYKALHLGPIIRGSLGELAGGEVMMHFSYQRSLNANYAYQINDASYVAILTVNSAELGVERLSSTRYGRMSLGLNLRREWVSMKQNLDDSVVVSSASRTADSFGLMIGHDFAWNL